MTDSFDGARRRFFSIALAAVACSVAAPSVSFAAIPRAKGLKSLAFHNLHTDERLRVAYWKDGVYSRPALAKISRVMRDHRSGEERPVNLRLLELLHDLQGKIGSDAALEIISGYRAPRTNAMMASASDGVARHSYHTRAMAADIRLPGISLSGLRKTALAMGRGGVGYYPDSGFVHVDVGPVRQW